MRDLDGFKVRPGPSTDVKLLERYSAIATRNVESEANTASVLDWICNFKSLVRRKQCCLFYSKRVSKGMNRVNRCQSSIKNFTF